MITYEVGNLKHDGSPGSLADISGFSGLSSDTKPTGTFDGRGIENGASFFEIDTQVVCFYDKESEVWN